MAVIMESRMGGEGTLPQDHEDQIQLGIRIIQSAHQTKVHNLEQEIRGLRLTSEEQRGSLANLQAKNSSLQVELVESHQRSQQLAEENKELFKTCNSLRKQLGRLEHLKSMIISTVQEDDEKQAELGDGKALISADYLNSATPLTAMFASGAGLRALTSGAMVNHLHDANAQRNVPQEPMALQGQPQSYGGQGHIAQGMSPPGHATPPGQVSSPGVIDGKAFFRQARGKLSYEAFNQFLQSIKRLNTQQQTREETLDEARRLFGPGLNDLYADFENLLNRQAVSP